MSNRTGSRGLQILCDGTLLAGGLECLISSLSIYMGDLEGVWHGCTLDVLGNGRFRNSPVLKTACTILVRPLPRWVFRLAIALSVPSLPSAPLPMSASHIQAPSLLLRRVLIKWHTPRGWRPGCIIPWQKNSKMPYFRHVIAFFNDSIQTEIFKGVKF